MRYRRGLSLMPVGAVQLMMKRTAQVSFTRYFGGITALFTSV